MKEKNTIATMQQEPQIHKSIERRKKSSIHTNLFVRALQNFVNMHERNHSRLAMPTNNSRSSHSITQMPKKRCFLNAFKTLCIIPLLHCTHLSISSLYLFPLVHHVCVFRFFYVFFLLCCYLLTLDELLYFIHVYMEEMKIIKIYIMFQNVQISTLIYDPPERAANIVSVTRIIIMTIVQSLKVGKKQAHTNICVDCGKENQFTS